jgi:competence protein ComEC
VVVLQLWGVRWPWPWVVLSSAAVVCAFDPWALQQPGFWLSFGAVALLMAADQGRAERATSKPSAAHGPDRAAAFAPLHRACVSAPLHRASAFAPLHRAVAAASELLRTQWIATVGLAPMTLVLFHQMSIVGFAANLLAIPLVTLLVTPLALAGVVVPWCWTLAAGLVDALVRLLSWSAQAPVAVWTVAAVPAGVAAIALGGGVLLSLRLPWRVKAFGLAWVLPLLLPAVARPQEGAFEALVADVGQGTAVIVRTRRHALLYDSGPAFAPQRDAGERVLVPLLRALGHRQLDAMVLSHGDLDHVGGARSVARAVTVHEVMSSMPSDDAAHPPGLAHRRCIAGQSWQWDGVRFHVLHPSAQDYAPAAAKRNAMSCVLRVVDAQGRAMLLTGDVEAPQEQALVERAREAGDTASLLSQVLLVPHHGSRTSSTPAFLDAVAPAVAVAQLGYRNRFGHPAPTVAQRYVALGVPLVRSDRCGAWRRAGDGSMSCERERRARYWHHR